MRVSADKANPAFHARYFDCRVSLDGIPQRDVITADDEEGWVERFAKDENGKVIIDGDEFRSERVSGRVELTVPSDV